MAPDAQRIIKKNIINANCFEQEGIHALFGELEKGIQNIKRGEVYTIEEAWEEIDKI